MARKWLSDEGADYLLRSYVETHQYWRAVSVADVLSVRGIEQSSPDEVSAWRRQSVAATPLTAAEQSACCHRSSRGPLGRR